MRKFHHRILGLLALGLIAVLVGCVEKSKEIPAEVPDPATMNQGGPPPGTDPAGAAMVGDQSKTTHAIMEKIGEGPNSLTAQLDAAIKAETIEWEKLDTILKEYVDLASSMSRGRPPVGSLETWPMFTKDFATKATAVRDAAAKQDKAATAAAFGELTMTCAACHKAHKPGANKDEAKSE